MRDGSSLSVGRGRPTLIFHAPSSTALLNRRRTILADLREAVQAAHGAANTLKARDRRHAILHDFLTFHGYPADMLLDESHLLDFLVHAVSAVRACSDAPSLLMTVNQHNGARGGPLFAMTSPQVKQVMRGLQRVFSDDVRQKAPPMTSALLLALVSALAGKLLVNSFSELQLVAWCTVCFALAARSGEASSSLVRGDFVLAPDASSFTLRLPHTKTSLTPVERVAFARTDDARLCPVRWMRRYMEHLPVLAGSPAEVAALPLFCTSQDARVARSTRSLVGHMQSVLASVPDAPRLTGHSLRRGAATEAFHSGATDAELMALGGWSSSRAAHGYLDGAQRSVAELLAHGPHARRGGSAPSASPTDSDV